jgi:thiol-disulfide isomerase/thioredoxin
LWNTFLDDFLVFNQLFIIDGRSQNLEQNLHAEPIKQNAYCVVNLSVFQRQLMKKYLFLLLFVANIAFAQSVESVKLVDLQKIIQGSSERILVINFWATWCAPCIKELPFFEKVNQSNENAAVILVSMDYDLDPNTEKVNKFVARKKIKSRVLVLTESDPNSWIDKIDKRWSGALPATLVVNTKTSKRELVQGELGEGELEKLIAKVHQ